jgi:hypothetical protein
VNKKKQKNFISFPPGDASTFREKRPKVFCGARAAMIERSEV